MSTETMQRVTRPWAELHEDTEWLAESGCTFERPAERLGITQEWLRKTYRRRGVALPLAWRVEGR